MLQGNINTVIKGNTNTTYNTNRLKNNMHTFFYIQHLPKWGTIADLIPADTLIYTFFYANNSPMLCTLQTNKILTGEREIMDLDKTHINI